jgi:methionine-gamma-lyase
MKFSTRAVHGGRSNLGYAHVPPIDLSTTYKTPDLSDATDSIDSMAMGQLPKGTPIYQRLHNPTVARFEQALAGLENAEQAVSFSSGMAAVTAALLAARMVGNHVIAIRPVYGGTDHLLASGLLDMQVSWATPSTVQNYIRPNTSLIICETPANPTLQLIDIEEVVRQSNGVPVLVDSTFATPVLQQPLECGAQLVLHSCTKFIGGHGDVMAGVIACNEEWGARLRQVRILTGANLHPMAAYTLHRGLQTLTIRVLKAQQNARVLVQRLIQHSNVERVMYPELPECDPSGILGRQLKGPGSMISIELKGGYEAAHQVMASVELITPAVSLGSCDTLIQHPAGLTHRIVDPKAQKEGGIGPGLIRISVGIEDVEDLWSELEQVLDSLDKSLPLSAK